jgi:hypothetical protein
VPLLNASLMQSKVNSRSAQFSTAIRHVCEWYLNRCFDWPLLVLPILQAESDQVPGAPAEIGG